ncbi:SHOCT domain-containing protein [Streptomyces sp. ISL-1]|uniref:SHOCT domain-containing protein n=1 Tax=Streptomyces sp. ISL-1 TaxID=2817657 RepID=UPI001BEA1217|nr:SHOCT domain-containing protein [Streptomyces sp. ISL-1]MBT2388657.1 SHOCT domain-containing protein [Streptomyces sp. ISL-1]
MDDYPLLNLFWTMLWFFIWVMWLFLLFKVVTDIFRSHDLNGWLKAGWLILVLAVPFVGVLVYVIVRGKSMGERDAQQAKAADESVKAYIRDAAGSGGRTGGGADELARLAELKEKGLLTDEEFQRAKDKLLA